MPNPTSQHATTKDPSSAWCVTRTKYFTMISGHTFKGELYVGYAISQLNATWNCRYQHNSDHKNKKADLHPVLQNHTLEKKHGHFAEKFYPRQQLPHFKSEKEPAL